MIESVAYKIVVKQEVFYFRIMCPILHHINDEGLRQVSSLIPYKFAASRRRAIPRYIRLRTEW